MSFCRHSLKFSLSSKHTLLAVLPAPTGTCPIEADAWAVMLQAHQQQRQAACAENKSVTPRFQRLMARLELSDKEQLAMLYMLVKQVSQEDFSNLFPKFGRSSPSFAAFAGLVSCCLCATFGQLGDSKILPSCWTTHLCSVGHSGVQLPGCCFALCTSPQVL